MSKFVVRKKFLLDFVNDEWKEKGAYLELSAFSVSDIKDKLSKLTGVEETSAESVTSALDSMISLLEEKFLGGKAVDEKGELVDLVKSDIRELPVEIISKAIGFLSQGVSKQS